MKRKYFIYAASCVLCLLSSCNEQMMVEENQQPTSSISLKSANWNDDYYMCLEKLAFTFYETFQASEEFRELVINKFASTGRSNLLIQELVGDEWDTRIGHLWANNPCGEFIADITQIYPNIRLTIVDDIEEIYDYIPSFTSSVARSDGGEAAVPTDENVYIAVGYKFVGTPLDEPMLAYTTQSGSEITDIVNYDDFPIIIEGGSEYSDEEIADAVFYKGQGGQTGKDDITIFVIELGKKCKDTAHGICRIKIGPWTIIDNGMQVAINENRLVAVEYEGSLDLSDLTTIPLELASSPAIDMTNVWMSIDEEILVTDEYCETLYKIVPIQQSVFNPSMGEYGGFELRVEDL